MNLALFDFDGTISFEDGSVPFVRFAARERIVVGSLLLSPLIVAYELGLVTATRLRAAIACGFSRSARGRAPRSRRALREHVPRAGFDRTRSPSSAGISSRATRWSWSALRCTPIFRAGAPSRRSS
jgi:hypothetical protein